MNYRNIIKEYINYVNHIGKPHLNYIDTGLFYDKKNDICFNAKVYTNIKENDIITSEFIIVYMKGDNFKLFIYKNNTKYFNTCYLNNKNIIINDDEFKKMIKKKYKVDKWPNLEEINFDTLNEDPSNIYDNLIENNHFINNIMNNICNKKIDNTSFLSYLFTNGKKDLIEDIKQFIDPVSRKKEKLSKYINFVKLIYNFYKSYFDINYIKPVTFFLSEKGKKYICYLFVIEFEMLDDDVLLCDYFLIIHDVDDNNDNKNLIIFKTEKYDYYLKMKVDIDIKNMDAKKIFFIVYDILKNNMDNMSKEKIKEGNKESSLFEKFGNNKLYIIKDVLYGLDKDKLDVFIQSILNQNASEDKSLFCELADNEEFMNKNLCENHSANDSE